MRRNFNPRSPHGERRSKRRRGKTTRRFQSTLPARGATAYLRRSRHPRLHFNPRSPHGERLVRGHGSVRRNQFQSTLPARGATREIIIDAADMSISIHAPRTGSDVVQLKVVYRREKFQSTLPARGATCKTCVRRWEPAYFNPRSPHGERRLSRRPGVRASDFNPRSPHGERHLFRALRRAHIVISIHAPRTGSDLFCACTTKVKISFQSTLPARGATSANRADAAA